MNGSDTEQEPLKTPVFDVVVVASSAGGVEALRNIVSALPADFPAAIILAQHLAPYRKSFLADILSRCSLLKVADAEDGQKIAPGTVLLCPPNHNTAVGPDKTIHLMPPPPEGQAQPSANALFESAANVYGKRVLAIVLSGTGFDGSKGISYIKEANGTVIAEDAKTARFSGMPLAAFQTGHVDFSLPLGEIGNAMVSLVTRGELNR